VLLKFVLNVLDVTTEGARNRLKPLPRLDLKFGLIPELGDILTKLSLELELLVSGVSNVFNVFLEGKEVGLEKLGEGEGLARIGNVLLGQSNDLVPMSGAD